MFVKEINANLQSYENRQIDAKPKSILVKSQHRSVIGIPMTERLLMLSMRLTKWAPIQVLVQLWNLDEDICASDRGNVDEVDENDDTVKPINCCFPRSVVSRESLEHLHNLCAEVLVDLDEKPQEEVLTKMFPCDGDFVIPADRVLRAVPMEQVVGSAGVDVMFRWMWSWPLGTPTEFLIEFAQRQFNALVQDDGARDQGSSMRVYKS